MRVRQTLHGARRAGKKGGNGEFFSIANVGASRRTKFGFETPIFPPQDSRCKARTKIDDHYAAQAVALSATHANRGGQNSAYKRTFAFAIITP